MKDDFLMPKTYDPRMVEDEVYALWENAGYFNPDNLPNVDEEAEHFSIVLPPPNVTGTLHMGHAMMIAIEDAMVRFARMQGKKTLWLPGTDHAAIATQSKVEKILKNEENLSRHDLGREAFLEKVRVFAQDSHDTIVNQVRKMGASVDWSREAYTLDDERNNAVNHAFKRMHEDGLIYKGYRVINWDPIGQTTVSDDEVVHKESTAKLYTFRYGEDCPIPIATTRPETKVGDTAIAVHPEGKWKKYIGETFSVEFAGVKSSLLVIGDEEVDDAFGTGALGVTPAHSQTDYEMAQKNDLKMVQVINEDARMTDDAGDLVAGKTTLEAREIIIAWLQENTLLEKEEEISQNLSVAERTSGTIEPLPKEQWFIDVNKTFSFKNSERVPIEGIESDEEVTLKSLMQHVVESGQIEILPDRFKKTYFHWIDNLRDWNISRQIWFGHRVPVWYKDDEVRIGEAPSEEGWKQDDDTLDTWFSSGLWTFSTLGWPSDQAKDFQNFHPTSVLETGYDILFFWVARMILMSTYLVGEVPFKTVYLHGLVRDEKGRKMSKSLGNAMNPLDMIEEYGADATRLSLLIGATPGNDMKLSEEKVAGFRNFTNKLWNISRFVFASVQQVQIIENVDADTLADRWILGRLSEVTKEVTDHCEKYEYSLAGEKLRDFTWNEFADWYIEIAKIQNQNQNGSSDSVLLYVLQSILKLWHPFMPFVTEEIYKQFNAGQLIIASWPESQMNLSASDKRHFELLQSIVSGIRNIRANYSIAPNKSVNTIFVHANALQNSEEVLRRLARIDTITWTDEIPVVKQASRFMVGRQQVIIPLEGLIDIDAEKERIHAKITEANTYKESLESRLGNDSYVENAPEQVVAESKNQLEEVKEKIQLLEEELKNFD